MSATIASDSTPSAGGVATRWTAPGSEAHNLCTQQGLDVGVPLPE
jgi:hypothetical protein